MELKDLLADGLGNFETVTFLDNWWEMAPGAEDSQPNLAYAFRAEQYQVPWRDDRCKEYWEEHELWLEVWECGPYWAYTVGLRYGEENPYEEHGYPNHGPKYLDYAHCLADGWRAALAWEEQWVNDGGLEGFKSRKA